jgi:hypothetical protein
LLEEFEEYGLEKFRQQKKRFASAEKKAYF